MRVVVLGASRNFGARICRALEATAEIELLRAGRHIPDMWMRAGVLHAQLDITAPGFADALAGVRPGLVIHCVGPFQGQNYRVVRAALAAGAHYLDLSDGRVYVAGFANANDAQARAADRVAISGASTLPALSSAVIDELLGRLETLDAIEMAIAPGQRAPRGVATLKSVFSYVGEPFLWLEQGKWVSAHGWQRLRRVQFDFGRRWAAACDVPDLELLPPRYPTVRTVQFRAALEIAVQQFALSIVAALRRCGLRLPLERWAAGLDRLASLMDRLGSDCGGMQVSLSGVRPGGSRHRVTWQLTAEGNHGPEIPCIAAILLARRIAAGQIPRSGAYACMGFLTLADFGPEFARWGIRSRIEERPE
jgi:saccharopine dehydrogenase-like NADP-dependent oxidoreductase